MTALQVLPPRQVAVLILRDVLGFHASEVASMLDSSVESVNWTREALLLPLEPGSTVIDLARFLHDQPESASPDLLRSMLATFGRAP